MPRREDLDGDNIFVLHDFLTPDECQYYINASEAAGYGDAPITTSRGAIIAKDVRNNDRVMVDDTKLAAELFERLLPFLPANIDGSIPCGLNERFRYYRYTPGQKFDWHLDGRFYRDNGEMSHLTFMIYLNDGCTGGETLFNLSRSGGIRMDDPVLRVTPTMGKALVFRHRILHTGAMVLAGTKYVLRTDVMYRAS
ncbi:2OG-Fe(II) oxygenase [Limnoglobus roseus]|uniref:Prolyl 4-hydroxylase alpha subunit domain-containing protein n=1 Tax=Limnoglobus roseus TaxID=2598579 RepID=A0A5C1A9A9_9BACT|nr:2OG-Fe(II) oxygenase [Limnoglobus roseus]QEL13658.1 hypothetical protein PX52LOC_00516 [Limnoglobus roseus]